MNSKMYTVTEVLKFLEDAQTKKEPSITIQGVERLCAKRAGELFSLPANSVHCFINAKGNHLPCATFTLSA